MACGIIGHTCNGMEGEGRREEGGAEETKRKGRSVGSLGVKGIWAGGFCMLRTYSTCTPRERAAKLGKIKRNRCYK